MIRFNVMFFSQLILAFVSRVLMQETQNDFQRDQPLLFIQYKKSLAVSSAVVGCVTKGNATYYWLDIFPGDEPQCSCCDKDRDKFAQHIWQKKPHSSGIFLLDIIGRSVLFKFQKFHSCFEN